MNGRHKARTSAGKLGWARVKDMGPQRSTVPTLTDRGTCVWYDELVLGVY